MDGYNGTNNIRILIIFRFYADSRILATVFAYGQTASGKTYVSQLFELSDQLCTDLDGV